MVQSNIYSIIKSRFNGFLIQFVKLKTQNANMKLDKRKTTLKR